VLLVVLAFSRSEPPRPPAEVPPASRPAPSPSASAPARATPSPAETLRALETFAATNPDPEALLVRCDEARPLLRGTAQEAGLRAIEARAQELRKAKLDASRLDAALKQFREVSGRDGRFERREEMSRLLRASAEVAGARKAEVEKILADYEKGFLEAAAREAAQARAEAEQRAAAGKFAEAIARCEELPEPFRSTPAGEGIAKLREELARRAEEAARAETERRNAAWKAWQLKSITDDMTGRVLDAHAGREGVLCTHPFDPQAPATLERDVELGAGKRWSLVLWVAPHAQGDWELRVLVDGKTLETRAVSPKGSGWRQVRADLSPWAGKKARLRLEHVATGWDWEHGYWHGIEIVEGADDAIALPADAARLQGSIQLYGGPVLAGWFSDGAAEWTVNVPKAGRYAVELTYALAANNGGEYSIQAGSEKVSCRTQPTGGWDDYRTANPATLSLAAGTTTLSIRPVSINGGLMNLRQVRLLRLP
jgi:hypothetical protein